MSIKHLLICSIITLTVFSCSHVYKEYDKESFPTYAWKYGQEIIFNPTIADINKTYKLTLGIRHLYGFQLNSINVTVRSVSPSGKETTKDYELKIKDSEGKYISSCGGDLCDLEVMVEENIKFEEAGEYKYFVTHNVQADRIPGVMEFGFIIDEMN